MSYAETYPSHYTSPFSGEPVPPPIDPSIRIVPNRRQIDNRFPVLGFTIQTGDLPYFEVLLTTDRTLFAPANAGRRNAANFYASREDSGLIRATGADSLYLVPPAVLRGFAQAEPRPSEIFYTLIAFGSQDGSSPVFAHQPQALPSEAPSISIARGFTGQTLSTVLGISSEMLRRVGANSPEAGEKTSSGIHQPVNGNGNGNGNQPEADADQAEGEDGYAAEAQGANGSHGHGMEAASPDPSSGWVPQDGYEVHHRPPGDHTDSGTREPAEQNLPASASYDLGDTPERFGQGDGADFSYEDGYEDEGEAQVPSPFQSTAQESVFPQGFKEPDPLYDDEAGGEEDFGDVGLAVDAFNNNGGSQGTTAAGLSVPAMDYDYSANVGPSPVSGSNRDAHPSAAAANQEGAGSETDDDDAASYYDEAELPYQSLDAPVPAVAPVGGGVATGPAALTIDEKKRIIERVAPFESGRDLYKAINADGEFEGRFNRPGRAHPAFHKYHVGLSYGIVQYTQDSGSLGQLLNMMRQRDAANFDRIFGADAAALIRITNATGPSSSHVEGGRSARVQPVGGADLWQEPWVSRFRQAGDCVPFQAAQNELASANYIDPMLQFAAWLGLNTERALTMIVDRSIQMGVGGAKRWIIRIVNPVQTLSQQQQGLTALGHANIQAFQAATRGLAADGQWGPMTSAALVGALRALGAAAPIPIPTREQMLDALVRDAVGQPWERRVRELRSDSNLRDIVYQF